MCMVYGLVNMEDFTRVVFQNAIIKEQLAQRMYLGLAEKAGSEKIRQLFYKLAEEEILHENLFRKIDLNVIKIVNNQSLKNLNLLQNVDKEELNSDELRNEINKVLDFAIDEEQKAYEDYNLLMNHIDFGESRDVLKEIALQELQHRTMLQKVKLEFNDDDWSHIKIPDE